MPEAAARDLAATRGVEIVQGYGLTEAAPNVLCLPPEDAVRKRGSPGKPYPYVDVALRDPETGALEGRRGRARRARAERLRRLLAEPRGDRGRVRGRLAAHGRRRRARRRGLLPDPRPAQGHVHLRRRERLPGRGRGRAARAPGRRRRRRRRRARRALGRGRALAFVVLARGRAASEEELRRVLPRAARALQGAEAVRVRRRAAAVGDEQGAEGRAARGEQEVAA